MTGKRSRRLRYLLKQVRWREPRHVLTPIFLLHIVVKFSCATNFTPHYKKNSLEHIMGEIQKQEIPFYCIGLFYLKMPSIARRFAFYYTIL